MPAGHRRTLISVVLLVVALLVLYARLGNAADRAAVWSSGPPEISDEVRSAGLRFDPTVAAADRAWVLAAVAAARPEAQQLIAEVDGLVTVQTHRDLEDAIGYAEWAGERAVVSLDTAQLNGDRALDRNVVVLHELGHVIDFLLVPDELVQRLDAGIPRGTCRSTSDHMGACTAPEERFADTFAKWALRGAVSMAGSGYGIPTPPSLEDWGTPLGLMAAELAVEANGV
jgi:hypothetical protein